jgi:BioD-like phosphotransacetylase family protein
LRADLLNPLAPLQDLVDSVVVGAMGVENSIRLFKRGVLLITPGDRVDIVLAAATSASNPGQQLAGMVLTGDFKHQPAITQIIEKLPFPVLRANDEIYEVASTVHNLIVKTRAADTEKISVIRDIIATHVDVDKILSAL